MLAFVGGYVRLGSSSIPADPLKAVFLVIQTVETPNAMLLAGQQTNVGMHFFALASAVERRVCDVLHSAYI